MPATPWSELTVTQTGWTAGFIDLSFNSDDDLFIDFLFDGIKVLLSADASYTELALAGGATPSTELTTPSTAWTELTF